MPKKKILHSQWIDKENKSQREWLVRYIRKSTTATALIPLSRRGEPTKDQIDNCYRKLTEEAGHGLESLRHRMERAWNTYKSRTKNNNGVSVQLSQEAKSLAKKQSRELGISPSKWIELLILESTALDQDRISALLKAKQNEEKAIQDLANLQARVRNGLTQMNRILKHPDIKELNNDKIQTCLQINDDIRQATTRDMKTRLAKLIRELEDGYKTLCRQSTIADTQEVDSLKERLISEAQSLKSWLEEYDGHEKQFRQITYKANNLAIKAEKLLKSEILMDVQKTIKKKEELQESVKVFLKEKKS